MRPWLSPPQLKSFPQDLVLVGRATVLIKVGATRRAAHAQPRALPSPLPDPSLWTPRAHEAKCLPARALSAGKPWHSRALAPPGPPLRARRQGIAARLGVRWSLAREWAPIARRVLEQKEGVQRPGRMRFRTVVRTMRLWATGRAEQASTRLPPSVRRRLAAAIVRVRKLRGLE